MKEKDFFEIKMKEEINKRLASSDWNMTMASKINAQRSKTNQKIFYSISLSSLAAAAVVLIVLATGIKTGTEGIIYEEFIANQIKGTYDAAFKKDAAKTAVANKEIKTVTADQKDSAEKEAQVVRSEDLLFNSDMDSFISETLAMR